MRMLNWQGIKTRIFKLTLNRARLAVLILGLGALWGLTWLGVTTQTVVVGQRVRMLEDKLDRVNQENAQLEYDIAVLTQPKRIADRATALGFRPATPAQTVYLNVNYVPRVVFVQDHTSGEIGRTFDWAAWWNNTFTWIGLGSDARAAEASR